MSFKLKTILGIALIEVILLTLLVFSAVRFLQDSNETQLIERANTIARLLASMTADSVVSMDLATLDALLAQTQDNPDIAYIRIQHSDGFALAQTGTQALLDRPFVADKALSDDPADPIFDTSYPITISEQTFGYIELGLDTSQLDLFLQNAARQMLSVAALEVVLVGFFGFILGGLLTRQLKDLQKGAQKVAAGDLGYTITVKGKDELADTANSFNEMSQSLAQLAQDLKDARRRSDAKRQEAEAVLENAIESLQQGVLVTDTQDQIIYINQAYLALYDITDKNLTSTLCAHDLRHFMKGPKDTLPLCHETPDTETMPITRLDNGRHIMHSVRQMANGGIVWVDTDISDLMDSQERNRKLEHDLLQSQKMESIGTLAGGIAHEINTPIQYIGDNLRFLGESCEDMLSVINSMDPILKTLPSDQAAPIHEAMEDADIDFLREELPQAIQQSSDGVKQVTNIVLAMKEFAHPSSKDKTPVNVNRVIERASVVCKNEWKSVTALDFDFDDKLPTIMALEGDLNQVMLNLIVNAAHAIEGADIEQGQITISTRHDDSSVYLVVADNGPGVPFNIRKRIFDPFFTTKDVGKGSGQGLAITHDIVVNKHHGQIKVSDNEGQGAKFVLQFPLGKDVA